MVLIYGDLINSRQLSPKTIMAFWTFLAQQNKKQKYIVPFYICLGDAFHGVVESPAAAEAWINNFREDLKKLGIKARYSVIPVRGDFSNINTPKKYEKVANKLKYLIINPLNIPELVIADRELEKIKKTKSDQILWIKKPTIRERQRSHKVMTLEYLK